MVRVESKKVELPPPIEIVMTMDMLTARAVKTAVQIAMRRDNPTQTTSQNAHALLATVADALYKTGVIIQPDDVVNKPY